MVGTSCAFAGRCPGTRSNVGQRGAVGRRVRTKAFELLAIMLLFEAMFGLAGLVMAPIIYAYAKAELRAAGWL